MSNTITLTQEQIEALNRGESITIQPQIKQTQWEPKDGDWYVDPYGEVDRCSSDKKSKNFGVERETKEKAEYAATQMRVHNRLLAYVAEFDKDWVADWNDNNQPKWHVYYDFSDKEYSINCAYIANNISTVYMSKQCAEELCSKLNSGEVVL